MMKHSFRSLVPAASCLAMFPEAGWNCAAPGRPGRGAAPVNAVLVRALRTGPLVSRIVAAVFGGYALAALASVAAVALPMVKPQAVLTGMLASFAVYAGAVVWVFAVRSARRAWIGLAIAALVLLLPAWSVWSGGTTA